MNLMRIVFCALASLVLVGTSFSAQARNLTQGELYMCSWGSGVAGNAQASKLSGITRYSARTRLQAHKYPKQWMRVMALRISEQTYDNESRLKPQGVKQIYYDGCIKHELARR